MSVNCSNLFAFSRSLPKPFEGCDKKVSVSSKYGDGTKATLSASVIKAINAICACFIGTEGAVGVIDNRTVAEYKSSVSPHSFHLVVYNRTDGTVLASVYDNETEAMERYVLNASGRDGAAIMMALYPVLMEDAEFKENFDIYYKQFKVAFTDFDTAHDAMAIMCDNAYRRIKDPTNPRHIKVEIDLSGNLTMVSQASLDANAFVPKTVSAGEFTIFAKTDRARKVSFSSVDHADFVGKYAFSEREFTAEEEALIPTLPDWYIIPREVVYVCNHAKATTGRPTQMRNFLLRGSAGSGKTMGAKAIAAGLHLPYVKYTCSAGTEIFDFIGQVFPATGKDNAENGSKREPFTDLEGQLKDYAGFAKRYHLPALDDIEYAPEKAYRELTGESKTNATAQDCMAALLQKALVGAVMSIGQEGGGRTHGQEFIYTETDFLKALKNGYVVEIQEPTTILQPGVLVGLNSLLEQGGSILLPTGQQIQRHPDAVVIVTTNMTYEGCRGMNQSVTDRMSLVVDVELPDADVMVQRAMSITGSTDDYQVTLMVEVVNKIAEYCRKNGVTDGTIGMRSLIDWIVSSEITGDVYGSALHTIISKATSDEEERAALVTTILEPIFVPTA